MHQQTSKYGPFCVDSTFSASKQKMRHRIVANAQLNVNTSKALLNVSALWSWHAYKIMSQDETKWTIGYKQLRHQLIY